MGEKNATFLEQATAKSNPDEVAWSEMNTYQNRHSNGIIPTAHMTIKTEKNIFKQMGRTSGVWRGKSRIVSEYPHQKPPNE